MKKLLISASMIGALLCAGCATGRPFEALADNASDLSGLLASYIDTDGTYTKKTEIFFNEETKKETEHFHAGHNVLKRTTYYDETKDALLMGDYDGGFANIKSGYRKVAGAEAGDKDRMEHYFYNGDNTSTDDYFTAATHDYYVKDTTPNSYFVNLSKLAEDVTTMDWTKDGNAYKHEFDDLSFVDGEYADKKLKDFQYFVAPMLLQEDHYLSFDNVRIEATHSWLSIRLFTTVSDAGKLTLADDNQGLLAEARIFKGLQKEEVSAAVLKGSFDGWGAGSAMTYFPSLYEPEQYVIHKTLAKDAEFKAVIGADDWFGWNELENQDIWFGFNDTNIKSNIGDTSFTIYLKGMGRSMYIGIDDMKVITLTAPSGWSDGIARTTIHLWGDGIGTTWPGLTMTKASTETETYTISVPTTASLTGAVVCGVRDNDFVKNKTANFDLTGNPDNLYINDWDPGQKEDSGTYRIDNITPKAA